MDFEAASAAELMFKLFCFTLDLSFSVCSQVLSLFLLINIDQNSAIYFTLSFSHKNDSSYSVSSFTTISLCLSLSLSTYFNLPFTFISSFSFLNLTLYEMGLFYLTLSVYISIDAWFVLSLSFHHHLLVPDSFFLHLFRYLCAWEETDINKSRPSIGVELRGQVSVFLCFYTISTSLSLSLSPLPWLLYLFKLRSCMGRLS